MDFLPNVSFNSLVVPPTIQHVKLEKMSKQIKSDVNQMMPIKCDNIVKDNLIDLTNKNSSNPILIKEKITQFENIQNNNIIKDNFISPSSKNIPHHVFIKETNMGCDFFNKDVLKPFNGTSRNEEHLNHFVQLMKENPTLKKKKKKTLTKKMMTKILLYIKKILKTFINMHVIVVKHCVSHFKFILFLNYILINCLIIF
jgi:hypothetical protein